MGEVGQIQSGPGASCESRAEEVKQQDWGEKEEEGKREMEKEGVKG